jgi:hypothetical protein
LPADVHPADTRSPQPGVRGRPARSVVGALERAGNNLLETIPTVELVHLGGRRFCRRRLQTCKTSLMPTMHQPPS